MKKLKSILCVTFAFILTAIVLCACGLNNQNKNKQAVGTKTTISLAEAEQLIVSALAIDNNKLQTQSTRGMILHAADANERNRDIMKKLSTFTFNQRTTEIDVETSNVKSEIYINAELLYESEIKKCLMENSWDASPRIDYFDSDNHFCYTYDDEKVSSDPYLDEELNRNRFAYVRALFTDEAFDRVYDDEAAKETKQDGYSITLTGDLKGWFYYIYLIWGYDTNDIDKEYNELINGLPQETIDKCYFNLTVNIDSNNNVVSASVDVKYLDPQNINTFDYMLITLTKTNTPIVEPTWVTEYKQLLN